MKMNRYLARPLQDSSQSVNFLLSMCAAPRLRPTELNVMQLTRYTDYSLRVLLYLAAEQPGARVKVSDLSLIHI